MTTRFDALPSSLRAHAQLEQFGSVPVLLARPEPASDPPPLLVWLHGRTANKELDPGRYLRCIRSGIAVCAMDLPGHGDRSDIALQTPERVIDVVLQAAGEIDEVTLAAIDRLGADPSRVAIGGMSAGGMASIARLLRPHQFAAACLEATSGTGPVFRWPRMPAGPLMSGSSQMILSPTSNRGERFRCLRFMPNLISGFQCSPSGASLTPSLRWDRRHSSSGSFTIALEPPVSMPVLVRTRPMPRQHRSSFFARHFLIENGVAQS